MWRSTSRVRAVCVLAVVWSGCSSGVAGSGDDASTDPDAAVLGDDARRGDDAVTVLSDGAVVTVDAVVTDAVVTIDGVVVTDVAGLDAVADDTVTAMDAPATIDAPIGSDVVTPPPTDVPVSPADAGVRVPVCIRTASAGEAGGTCAGLDQAYTARGINVGYYAFRTLRPVFQLSGDFDGDLTRTFARGASMAGVVLQQVPVGSYVGLSTVGPNYDPPTGCDVDTCGNPSRHACQDNSPPMRAPAAERYYWGYAYDGASHMQGWFLVLPGSLEYVGDQASHPCALGPAGADYEVHSACGRTTNCRGTNPTCGAVNRCDEGSDDCGRTQCGAMSGGPVTPSAWQRTVALPSGSHACSMRTPPEPSVRCLENGSDRDFFFVYPFGAYLYWAQNSTTRAWLHTGDRVQVYFHNRDAQGVLWDFVEVTRSGAPSLTPPSDGAGAASPCSDTRPEACHPCLHGGTCGWVQDIFLR